jgi:hypothetical protein
LKKKIKRKIKRGTGTKLYFNAETQARILEYQNSDSREEKEKLYVKHILPAFDKLVENLIFVYGFCNPYEQFSNLKNDCVSFLYETIVKWDHERGTKAFSYFNVVGKNWLIMNSRKSRKHIKKQVSLSDMSTLSIDDRRALMNFDFVPPPDEIYIKKFFRQEIFEILEEIKCRVKGEKEKICIDAIIVVFKNIDELDYLNKRAIFVYVRDISGLNPKQLSVAMSSIRKHYREIVKEKEKENQ